VSDLIDTTEMYLKTIFELEEEGITPLRARIAERLQQSGPTVSQTVARMERAGLVVVSGDRHLELTEVGRAKATSVMRKHRLAECLLIDVIGLDYEHVHEEACRWEHVMSERVERRLLEVLGHPTHSPYGIPIPGLAELGESGDDGSFLDGGVISLVEAARDGADQVQVRRLGEPVQVDIDLLGQLSDSGVRPGRTVQVRRVAGGVVVGGDGVDGLDLPDLTASHIFVTVPVPA
jgi:DtxR family Mn-dependent transcriptional regulator